MRALRLNSPNNYRMEDVEPGTLKPGWVRIHVKAVGVCGSDLASMAGKLAFTKFPITPGHEFSGIVTEVNACNHVKVGHYVTANPVFSCGVCSECQSGRINHCDKVEVLGVVNYNGAFAEELMLPESMIELLPESISYEEAAMIEPIAVAERAVREAHIHDGSHVAIFGAGNIGLLVLQISRAYGAEKILVIEPQASRIDVARDMGADITVTPDELKKQMSSYRDSFHAVVDGVSREDTLSSGIELGAKGGNILVYGVPKPDLTPIPLFNLFRKDMRVITCRLYQRSFKKAIELLSEGRIHVKPMITHRIALKDLPELIAKIAQGQEKAIKIIVNTED